MASSSPSPSPRRPLSCCPTTSGCSSKDLESPSPLTFHLNQSLNMIVALHLDAPSLSGTRIQAWCCQFVSLYTCWYIYPTVELSGKYQRKGCQDDCLSLRPCISLLPDLFPVIIYIAPSVETIQDTHVPSAAHPHWQFCHGPSRMLQERSDEPTPPWADCHVGRAGTEQQLWISIFPSYTFSRWSRLKLFEMYAAVE